MKFKSTVLMLVVMLALMLTTINDAPVASQLIQGSIVPYPSGPYEKYGPRVDRLTFVVSGGVTREADDFEAGLMDLMDWAAPAERWTDWLEDPEITMGEYDEFGQIFLAFNVMRWPLGHGDQEPSDPDWDLPEDYASNHDPALWGSNSTVSEIIIDGASANITWIDYDCDRCLDTRWFRRGLAHLVDRASQVAYMMGAGAALEPTIFVPALKVWEAEGVPEYEYSLTKAKECFLNGGFKDWDNDGWMEYSPGHDGVVKEELPKIVFYTRSDDAHRTYAGQILSDDMSNLGAGYGKIPHDLKIVTYGTVDEEVWIKYEYDIYIEYWTWTAVPDIYSELFHSRLDIYPGPYSMNEDRYHSKKFDLEADQFTNASTVSAALDPLYEMQRILHDDVPIVPYYCYVGYQGRATSYGDWAGEDKYAGRDWEGMCNFPGEGFACITEGSTYLNAHPQGFEKGGTLRQGLNVDAEMLDVIDAVYYYDQLVLAQVYENLLHFNAGNLSRFEPWLCENYTVGSWEHPTEGSCSAINFTLIPNILWQDGTPMTAEDVGFSFWFTRECQSVNYMFVKDFDSYKTYDTDPTRDGNETIELRFDVTSWLSLYWCGSVPIIPKHIWAPVTPSGSSAYIPEDHNTVFGCGPFRFYKDGVVGKVSRVPGEYLYLEANPIYFRKYIWPDVCGDPPLEPGEIDGDVDLYDFWQAADEDYFFIGEKTDGTWPTPPGDWGEPCDVDKDGWIGIGDLMEVYLHLGEPWPPSWYEWQTGQP